MNNVEKLLKPVPAYKHLAASKGAKGQEKEMVFHYLDEADFLAQEGGIGLEMENGEEFSSSELSHHIEKLTHWGVMCESKDHSRFTRERADREGSRYRKYNFSVGLDDTAPMLQNKITEALRVGVYPNVSTIIGAEPHIDKTVNYSKGGIEIVTQPFSLKALPILKMEIARIIHYRKMFGMMENLPDASTHLNSSLTLWGGTIDEQANTLTNFWNLLWFTKEFTMELSNRKGSGKDYADILLAIGDPMNSRREHIQDMLFVNLKDKAYAMLMETGFIGKENYISAAGSADERTKGFINTTVNAKNPVVEFRMFGNSPNPNWYIAITQWQYAAIEVSRTPWRLGLTPTEIRACALNVLVKEIYSKRETVYKEIWNHIVQMESTKQFWKEHPEYDTTPIFQLPLDMKAILAFDYGEYAPVPEEEDKKKLGQAELTSETISEESEAETSETSETLSPVEEEKQYTCCECDKIGELEEFNLEIEEDAEAGFPIRNEGNRWCNVCFRKMNPEDDEDEEEDEDEDETFFCDACGDEFLMEDQCNHDGKEVCPSCKHDLES